MYVSCYLIQQHGHVALMGEETGVYKVLVGKPEGKRPLERPRRRLVDNIRTDLQEVEWKSNRKSNVQLSVYFSTVFEGVYGSC